MAISTNGYLKHYGVSGQKWGVRRFQNEDGSLTEEGRDRLGIIGLENRAESPQNESSYGGRAKTKAVGSSFQNRNARSDDEQKAKTRRLMIGLGAVALTAIGVTAAVRYRKMTNKLIQMAKNRVHDDYQKYQSGSRINRVMTEEMGKIRSRRSAKAALGLKNRASVNSYIKRNHLRRTKISEIIERRTGLLAEGYKRSRITKKMRPISERKRRRLAEVFVRLHPNDF